MVRRLVWCPRHQGGFQFETVKLVSIDASYADRFLVQIAEAEEQHRRERLAKEQQQETDDTIKGGKAQ